jgi:hypothetical protein
MFAALIPVDYDLAASVLSPAQLQLFHKMRRSEQIHSLNVLRTLQGWGYDHPSLLVAALLHDSGKSRYPYTLFDKTLVVLVHKFLPAWSAKWSHMSPNGWYRPFTISRQHPKWSTEMATEAGTDPLALSLIEKHQDRFDHSTAKNEIEQLLAALQKADNAN